MNERGSNSDVRQQIIRPLYLILAVFISVAALCLATPSCYAGNAPISSPRAQVVADNTGLYDIEASGTDIKLVIDALARSSNANLIISPDISGNVTAHLKQLPMESLLTHLASTVNFDWRKEGDAYVLTSKDKPAASAVDKVEKLPPAPTVLVWQCKYIKPTDAAARLQQLFPKLKVVEGPGAITPTLNTSSSGTQYSSGVDQSSSGTSASTTTTTTSRSSNGGTSVILMGDGGEIDQAKQVLSQVDIRRPQVSIKVEITEINSSAKEDLGISWTWSDLIIKETAPKTGIQFGTFSKNNMSFDGVISALINHGQAKLLAQPNISVVNGETASILIGDRILFPKLVGYTTNGAAIYDKDEERVGIYLQICPSITDGGEVVMNLYPQVSLVTGYLNNYPQISTREAQTTVAVKNTQTLAIGGLIRDNEIKDATKIPLLGDLPIIGQFFRHTKTTKDRTEIVILLTPTIME